MIERRRFPPPWSVEEANAACFIVKDIRAAMRWHAGRGTKRKPQEQGALGSVVGDNKLCSPNVNNSHDNRMTL